MKRRSPCRIISSLNLLYPIISLLLVYIVKTRIIFADKNIHVLINTLHQH